MKSCLGILLVTLVCVAVVGGGALIWYMSGTSEFTRKSPPPPKEKPKSEVPAPTPLSGQRGLGAPGQRPAEH